MIKITVVTVCYNAAPYIEATLRSVLDQDYGALEYIVIDGASTDGTQAIIGRYADRLAYFESEPDDGQYHAIQKGLERATGEVMCWLNADDILMPWTLSVVGDIFAAHPDVNWLTGQPAFLNRRRQLTAIYGAVAAYPQHFIANGWYNRNLGGFLQQESMFWRRVLWEKTNGLDLSLNFAADYALWKSFAQHAPLVPVSVPLSAFRKLPGEQRSSLGAEQYDAEVARVMSTLRPPPLLWAWVSQRGVIARSLARILIRQRSAAILYDELSGEWRKTVTRRSIARVSLGDLILQQALRSQLKVENS